MEEQMDIILSEEEEDPTTQPYEVDSEPDDQVLLPPAATGVKRHVIDLEQDFQGKEKLTPPKKRAKFRISGKNLFLTYPKCDLPKEEALAQLTRKVPVQEYIVAQEKHQVSDPIPVFDPEASKHLETESNSSPGRALSSSPTRHTSVSVPSASPGSSPERSDQFHRPGYPSWNPGQAWSSTEWITLIESLYH